MSNTKKIIIFGLVALVLGVLAFIYFARSSDSETQGNAGGFSIKNFFPFGNPDEIVVTNDKDDNSSENAGANDQNSNNQTSNDLNINKLRKISDKPIAGSVIFLRGTTSIVRFVEKATGNIYEASSNSNSVVRLTNNTLPKIIRAFWLPDGSGFISQTLSENQIIYSSFIRLKAKSKTSTSTDSLPFETVISELPLEIEEIAVSPDSKKIFYYTIESEAKGYISNPDGTGAVLVFENPLYEWIPTWFASNSILLASKASSLGESQGFVLNIANKTLSKAYSGNIGASSIPRSDGKYILLGSGGVPTLSLFDNSVNNGSATSIKVKTLPEKCSWDETDKNFIFCAVPKNINKVFPDAWYQGSTQTNDFIERVNVSDAYVFVLSDLEKDSKEKIDAYNLKASKDGTNIVFTNKIDASLWMFRVK